MGVRGGLGTRVVTSGSYGCLGPLYAPCGCPGARLRGFCVFPDTVRPFIITNCSKGHVSSSPTTLVVVLLLNPVAKITDPGYEYGYETAMF